MLLSGMKEWDIYLFISLVFAFHFAKDCDETVWRSCEICGKVRQTRLAFHLSNITSQKPFELIHVDLWGPYHTPSFNGIKYFITIVVDFSRSTWVHLLATKSIAFTLSRAFFAMVETQFVRS